MNALQVVEELAQTQPVSVSDLARSVRLPKSTVFRILITLEASGWASADREASGLWRLTPHVFGIGLRAPTNAGLVDEALVAMAELRDTFGETVYLTVKNGNGLVVIARTDGRNPLRSFVELGTQIPFASTASGRAFLSALPLDHAEQLLRESVNGLESPTSRFYDLALADIVESAERGYCFDDGQGVLGTGGAVVLDSQQGGRVTSPPYGFGPVAGVAAPIRDNKSESPLAVLTVAMPIHQTDSIDVTRLGQEIVDQCAALSAKLAS